MQVVLAVDADAAGAALAGELGRRLGRQKCKLTAWPADWPAHALYLGTDEAYKRMRAYAKVRIVFARWCRHIVSLALVWLIVDMQWLHVPYMRRRVERAPHAV